MRIESSDHHEKDISKQLRKSNYYEILDLKQNATQSDIKRSFKQMALKYHPDKNSATYSKQVFHKVSQAYDTLTDPSKRGVYDQKQNFFNNSRQGFGSKEPTVFFQKSSSFYPDFDQEFKWSSYDYAKRKAAQQRMEDRAREERQKYRKQHNQKNKNPKKQYANPFFKKQSTGNKKAQQPKAEQKSEQKQIPKEYKYYFSFERKVPKETNERKTEYEQKRRQKQRKARLQKQRLKANKNMSMFMVFMLIIVLWIYLDYNKAQMRGAPVYSINYSSTHNVSKFTQKLNSPFYVTKDYISRAEADDRFRQHIEKKIDFSYIKLLSRMCNTNKQKEQELNNNLVLVKSIKSKTQILQKLNHLDLTSCSKLHYIRQLNPAYFQGLFSADTAKTEL